MRKKKENSGYTFRVAIDLSQNQYRALKDVAFFQSRTMKGIIAELLETHVISIAEDLRDKMANERRLLALETEIRKLNSDAHSRMPNKLSYSKQDSIISFNDFQSKMF